eukprot:m51a1_g10231 putative histidinol-phosphate aminotransferase (775) ;mRNA; r:164583-167304
MSAHQGEQQEQQLWFLRPDAGTLGSYAPVLPLEVVAAEVGVPVERLAKLDANENLYGPLPAVRAAAAASAMHIYPDPGHTALRGALSRWLGVPADCLVCGCGSDELIDVVLRAVDPAAAVVVAPPTFPMYAFLAGVAGRPVVSVPRAAGSLALDERALLAAVDERPGCVVCLVSPNNPTGDLAPRSLVRALAARRCLLLVDEAYAEFVSPGPHGPSSGGGGSSSAALELVHPGGAANVVVLRTFSKWAALAGLRVGYCVCAPALARVLAALKQPYNVSAAASDAACAVLAHAPEVMRTVALLREGRAAVERALAALRWLAPLPSESNFVLARVCGPLTGPELAALLRRRGVLVRAYPGAPALREFVRVSAGRPSDVALLEGALGDIDREVVGPRLRSRGRLAVLWDVDGVLADVSLSYHAAIVQTAARFGAEVSADDVEAAKRSGGCNNDWELTRALVAARLGEEATPALGAVTDAFEELYQGGLWRREALVPSPSSLRAMAARWPMGVVTGRPRRDYERLVEQHGLQGLFGASVCMEDAPAKPHPAGVKVCWNALATERAVLIGDTPDDTEAPGAMPRVGECERETAETHIVARVALDGTGACHAATGLGFLDHMLHTLACHSRIDVAVDVLRGDTRVDDHHTVEDAALALGTALDRALGDRRGLRRFGTAFAPLDEALARAVVDVVCRPHAAVDLGLRREALGAVSAENVGHFLRSLATSARVTMHVDVLRGDNDHHRAESAFKALALALRHAVEIDPAADPQAAPSTKQAM